MGLTGVLRRILKLNLRCMGAEFTERGGQGWRVALGMPRVYHIPIQEEGQSREQRPSGFDLKENQPMLPSFHFPFEPETVGFQLMFYNGLRVVSLQAGRKRELTISTVFKPFL